MVYFYLIRFHCFSGELVGERNDDGERPGTVWLSFFLFKLFLDVVAVGLVFDDDAESIGDVSPESRASLKVESFTDANVLFLRRGVLAECNDGDAKIECDAEEEEDEE